MVKEINFTQIHIIKNNGGQCFGNPNLLFFISCTIFLKESVCFLSSIPVSGGHPVKRNKILSFFNRYWVILFFCKGRVIKPKKQIPQSKTFGQYVQKRELFLLVTLRKIRLNTNKIFMCCQIGICVLSIGCFKTLSLRLDFPQYQPSNITFMEIYRNTHIFFPLFPFPSYNNTKIDKNIG